jgi:F-type H+-transporting ATPase subunit b
MENQSHEPMPFPPGEAGTLVEQPAEHKVFPPFDTSTFPSQLLWFALTFVLLYYLMSKVALPRIAGILEDRRDRIASDLDLAERLKQDSEAALTGYEKSLAEARTRANAIAEGARDGAKQAASAKRAATEASLAEKLGVAEKRIGEIKSKALADVGEIATETAEQVVKALVDTDVTRGEVSLAVANAMAK